MNCKIYRRRDLTIVELDGKKLVIACDSCGGVGEKNGDALWASLFTVGAYAARVPLMEVICAGAKVISVTNAVCCEMDPTGAKIIEGVKNEMKKAGAPEAALNGSTEENFPTVSTAVGVTVIGSADKLRFAECVPGDRIVLIGEPLFGAEISKSIPTDYNDVYRLLKNPDVKEIAPVGSKGVLYEAELLAELNGLRFSPYNSKNNSKIDMKKSAGPATCFIAAVSKPIGHTEIGAFCSRPADSR
jgi:selenophosphate synthetase-related protein